eukprot:5640408-Amphidinium_carterae.1
MEVQTLVSISDSTGHRGWSARQHLENMSSPLPRQRYINTSSKSACQNAMIQIPQGDKRAF